MPSRYQEFSAAGQSSRKHRIITEILRVDLEQRRNSGHEVSLQEYIDTYPKTFSDQSLLQELAYEDYRVLCVADQNPKAEEYAAKFAINTDTWAPPSALRGPTTPKPTDTESLLQPGMPFLDFTVIMEIGRGSFSRVFLAQQSDLANRFVVLKASKQLWDESDVLARLQHTNIMPIHSVHRQGEWQIVCMPFWGTCTLEDALHELSDSRGAGSEQAFLSTIANRRNETVISRIRENSIGEESEDRSEKSEPTPSTTGSDSSRNYLEVCLKLAAEVADALSHAHALGIVHSDLKPANILLAEDGRPLVLDFNLATQSDKPGQIGVGGTLPYMAPEHLQAMTNGSANSNNPSSDIFSLGVILYEMLEGTKPFPHRPGSSDETIGQLIADRKSVQPAVHAGSKSVQAILHKCLNPNLRDRYQTADQLRDDLMAQLRHQPLAHAPESVQERVAKSIRRNPRRFWITVAACLCATAAIAMFAIWQQKERLANETRALTAEKEYRDFLLDSDWINSVLMAPIASSEQQNAARTKADQWLQHYGQSSSSIKRDEPLSDELANLALTLAEARIEEAKSAKSSGRQDLSKSALKSAKGYNRMAASYLGADAFAVKMQNAVLVTWETGAAHQAPMIQKQPKTSIGFVIVAQRERQQGNLKAALQSMQTANSLAPRDYSIWSQLGYLHRERNEYDEAERCFSICLALRPDLAFSYFQRGLVRLERQDFETALQDFDQYLKWRPKDPHGHINRAIALKGLDKPRDSLAALDSAFQRGAKEPRLHLIRSELCHTLGDSKGATESFQAGLQLVPMDERNFLARGMAFLRKNMFDKALVDFEQALEKNPNSINARKNIAYVLSTHHSKPLQAADVVSDAIQILPNDAELIASRGVLLARGGQSEEACSDAKEALALSQQPPILIRIASIYALAHESKGDTTEAIQHLRKALAIDPSWAPVVARDEDLASLRKLKPFQDLVKAANTLLK